MTYSESINPFLFAVGAPRSGTTLLQRILDAHPEIAVFHEMRWIIQWYQRWIGLTPNAMVTPQFISHLSEHHKFRKRLQMSQGELETRLSRLAQDGKPVSYARFMSGVFDLYGEVQGKPLVGDKTPEYARYIPTLHDLWPQAKFIHIIRDGRDVCLSIMNFERPDRATASRFTTWSQDRLSTTAVWWERHVRLAREAGRSLRAELYHEIRYEALLEQPDRECVALCEFLGVPYDEAMIRFHEGRTRRDPNLDAKAAWLPITSGLRDWRTEMASEEVERFEAIAGDLLTELGYPRAFPRPQEGALRHASRIRERLVQDRRAQRLLRLQR